MFSHKIKTLLILFCILMAILFGGLTVWAWGTGTEIFKQAYSENQIADKKPEQPHGRFSVDKKQVMSMNVDAYTLEDSWIWVKAVIVDSKDRPVVDLSFNVEYYTADKYGENWTEGSQTESRPFTLTPGEYKLLLYAEDAQRSTRWTDPGDERIRVSIDKGVVISKYFEILFIVFALATVLLLFVSAED